MQWPSARDAGLGLADLLLEEVVLGDEQAHLEADLGFELRRRDGLLGEPADLSGLGLADPPPAARPRDLGEGGRLFARGGDRKPAASG